MTATFHALTSLALGYKYYGILTIVVVGLIVFLVVMKKRGG